MCDTDDALRIYLVHPQGALAAALFQRLFRGTGGLAATLPPEGYLLVALREIWSALDTMEHSIDPHRPRTAPVLIGRNGVAYELLSLSGSTACPIFDVRGLHAGAASYFSLSAADLELLLHRATSCHQGGAS